MMLLIIILSLYQRDIAEYHNYSHSSYFHTGLDCIFHLRGRPYSRWTFSLTFLYTISPPPHRATTKGKKKKPFTELGCGLPNLTRIITIPRFCTPGVTVQLSLYITVPASSKGFPEQFDLLLCNEVEL